MTIPVDDPRQLLAALEAQADSQDKLARRLIDNLRDLIDAREELEMLARHESRMRTARTCLIVEAAMLLTEREQMGEVIHLAAFRRPKPRLVQ